MPQRTQNKHKNPSPSHHVGTVGEGIVQELGFVLLNIYHLRAETPEDTLAQIQDLARTTLLKMGNNAHLLQQSPFLAQMSGDEALSSEVTLTGLPLPAGWSVEHDPAWEALRAQYPDPERVRRYDRAGDWLTVIEELREYQHTDGATHTWQHVSLSRPDRLPSWRDISFVKQTWFGAETTALQVFAPASAHFDHHPFCLHLWYPMDCPHLLPNFAAQNHGGI